MFYRRLLIAIAASGFLAGGALAQSALVEVRDNVMVEAFGAIADRVDDWDVYDLSGKEIGEVEEVVGTGRDTPTALVVDFDDDSAYPDRDVVIPLSEFVYENGRLTLKATPEAVSGMEVWHD